jgi:hypothetical protein
MAHLSKGTTITIVSDSPVVIIPEVSNIAGPERSKDEIETTHLTSTDKEFLTGFSDNQVSFEMNYQPGNTANQRLQDMFEADTLGNWEVDYTQLSPVVTVAFSARVLTLTDAAAVGDKLTRSVTLKISGAVTTTP